MRDPGQAGERTLLHADTHLFQQRHCSHFLKDHCRLHAQKAQIGGNGNEPEAKAK
jgi:hypothetical protein